MLLRVCRRLGRLPLGVTETLVPSSPAQFRALLAGDFDAVLTSPDNVLAYRWSPVNPLGVTAPVEMLAAIDRGMGLALYGDISGRRFGVDVPASGFAFAMYAIAESRGRPPGSYRVVTLGSTPSRLRSLLAGECDATMLNAGHELHAEAAGIPLVARVFEVCGPYLGTVLAALRPIPWLSAALIRTGAEIVAGQHDELVLSSARDALGLSGDLAVRYLDRLRSATEGLIPDGVVDRPSLRTVVDLRRRYGPALDGDPLSPALA